MSTKKRDLFAELEQSITEFKDHDVKKITLKTSEIEVLPPVKITADEIISIRKKYNVSRAVFANMLRIKTRKLEAWEQNRSTPSPESATLIRLIDRDIQMVDVIQAL